MSNSSRDVETCLHDHLLAIQNKKYLLVKKTRKRIDELMCPCMDRYRIRNYKNRKFWKTLVCSLLIMVMLVVLCFSVTYAEYWGALRCAFYGNQHCFYPFDLFPDDPCNYPIAY